MKVQVAQPEDIDSWLRLAAGVEHLFGPMVNDPSFMDALKRNIERGSAFCIRESDGPSGAPLQAGMLFSAKPPVYRIGWLSVSEEQRRCGLGTALLDHVSRMVRVPAKIIVTTFVPVVAGGEAARAFYLDAGFRPAETVENDPEGGSRQVFRKTMN